MPVEVVWPSNPLVHISSMRVIIANTITISGNHDEMPYLSQSSHARVPGKPSKQRLPDVRRRFTEEAAENGSFQLSECDPED